MSARPQGFRSTTGERKMRCVGPGERSRPLVSLGPGPSHQNDSLAKSSRPSRRPWAGRPSSEGIFERLPRTVFRCGTVVSGLPSWAFGQDPLSVSFTSTTHRVPDVSLGAGPGSGPYACSADEARLRDAPAVDRGHVGIPATRIGRRTSTVLCMGSPPVEPKRSRSRQASRARAASVPRLFQWSPL
jgi:hypothetical protein